ncbi:hypothetical protein NQZ68_005605 [Dissostichus eleginoides]|nr:hypothetical protein NQZ68_005605 [Dissostichus eleginoides]
MADLELFVAPVKLLSLGHIVNTTVSWGHQGHDEQQAAAIIGAQLGYASLKNALGFALKISMLNAKNLNNAVFKYS